MNFSFFLKLYLLTIPVFFLIDLLWLGLIAKNFYNKNLGHLLADKVNWFAAIIFYLIFIGGILYFAVVPGLEVGNWQQVMLKGALFGFITYATYDFTNWATLKDWPLTVVIVDVLWGAFLCATVATVSYFIAIWLL